LGDGVCLLYTLLGVAVVTTGGVFVSARNVMNTVTKPIERLRDALREVAEGDFGIKIAARMRADDFGEIARDIDVISDRVTDALAEQNALRAEGEKVIERLRAGMTRLAKGDFSDRIDDRFPGSYDALRQNYNETVDRLNELLAQVVQASNRIQGQSVEIQGGSENLSSRTESQAATLEETAAALEEMTRSVNSSAQNAKEVETVVENARKDVERSGEVVEGAISAMNEIENSSNQISQIIGVIDDIAFQTNLLALNAGVEAARAGESGRGFAVVASEVRGLAQRAATSAKEIKELIGVSASHVEEGVTMVNEAGEALHAIVTGVQRVSGLTTNIASASQEQSTGLNEINSGMSHLDQVTQHNAAMFEETPAAVMAMREGIQTLSGMVSRYTVAGGSALAPAMAAPSAHGDDGFWEDDEMMRAAG
jgi:methyl-accepting chemotaxis protein